MNLFNVLHPQCFDMEEKIEGLLDRITNKVQKYINHWHELKTSGVPNDSKNCGNLRVGAEATSVFESASKLIEFKDFSISLST